MLVENKGVHLLSRPLTFTAGTTQNFDLSFLQQALRTMKAPVVREVILHFNGSVSGVTGGHVGEDAFQIFSKVLITDRAGTLVDMPGKLLRVDEQNERGTRQVDPADVASGATNTDYDMWLRIPFDLEQAHRGSDTALPLVHLTEGGEIRLTLANPPVGTVNSGTIRMYVLVHDERERKLKSRLVRRDVAITAAEDSYRVGNGGSLRKALISSNKTSSAGYTSLSSYTSIDSPELLRIPNLNPRFLIQEYRACRPDFASGDEVIANNAIPVVWPSPGQHIGKMPSLDSFMVKLASAPTDGRMVLHYIEDRDPGLAAEWLGYASIDEYVSAFRKNGVVDAQGGGEKSVQGWAPELVRRLPARIKTA